MHARAFGRRGCPVISRKVKAEARKLAEPQAADLKKRTDLRHWPIFTIDSAQTKDIDDAISLAVSEAEL